MKQKCYKVLLRDLEKNGSPIAIAERSGATPYHSRLHRHDFYELFILLENDIRHNVNGVWHSIKENSLQLLRPNDAHFYRPRHQGEGQGVINISFPLQYMTRAMQYLRISDERLRAEDLFVMHPIPKELMSSIYAKVAHLKKDNLSAAEKERIFLSLLTEIVPPLCADTHTTEKSLPLWLHDAIEQMSEPSNLQCGLPRLIELSGKSQNHLNKTLQKFCNCSSSQFIHKLRFEQVNTKLISTDAKIIDILFDAGFNNIPYFNASYKKHFGITPREYRNRMVHYR